jgi:hypothetical protein
VSAVSTILLLLIVGTVGVCTLELFARFPMFVAYVVLGLTALIALLAPAFVPTLSVGAVTVYAPDIIFSLIAGGAFIRLLGLRGLSVGHTALVVVVVLAMVAALRGIPDDLQGSLNEFRSVFYFLAGATYFATVTREEWRLRSLTYSFVICAALILTSALLLWGPSPSFMPEPYESGYRVIEAKQTLVLAQAFLLTTAAWFRPTRNPPLQWLSVAFLLGVIALQHRTVWISLIVGLLTLAWRDPRVGRSAVAILSVITVVVVSIQMVAPSGPDTPLTESLTNRSLKLDTFYWRIEGWQRLVRAEGPSTTGELLLGQPYGTGFERLVESESIDVQPHNYFLNQYLRHGLIGVMAFTLMYLSIVSALRRQPPTREAGFSNPSTVLALVVMQLVFFIAYNPGIEQGLITGLALSLGLHTPSQVPATTGRTP